MKRNSIRRAVRFCVAAGIALFMGAFGLVGLAHAQNDTELAPQDNPTFAIINPLYFGSVAQGPVGTNVTVRADNGSTWTVGATIVLGVLVDGNGTCASGSDTPVTATDGPITVNGSGGFVATFAWPSNASQITTYRVCAHEQGTGTQTGSSKNTFTVLSSAPPTIIAAPTSGHAGDSVFVNGANWLPVQTVTLKLQLTGTSFQVDPGEDLGTATPDGSGNFRAEVKLPGDRVGADVNIVAVMGTPFNGSNGTYPLIAYSSKIVISNAPTPTVTATVAATATTAVGGSTTGTNTNKGNESLLIALLGVIAVVLLGAGVVVAILALRGRNTRGPGPNSGGWDKPGGPPSGYGGYDPSWDQTQAGGPPWDGGWQQQAGQPWSGRDSRAYGGPQMPPAGAPYDDEEDDRFRTRMGDPYRPPNPGASYPQRPMGGPPPSRPSPNSRPNSPGSPAGQPGWSPWGEDPNGNTDPGNTQQRR